MKTAENMLDQEGLSDSVSCYFHLWFLLTIAVCPFYHWKSDGLCDDINNKKDCGYDGGDCCGEDAVNQYCFNCSCLGKIRHILFSNTKNWKSNKECLALQILL